MLWALKDIGLTLELTAEAKRESRAGVVTVFRNLEQYQSAPYTDSHRFGAASYT